MSLNFSKTKQKSIRYRSTNLLFKILCKNKMNKFIKWINNKIFCFNI